ncbi:hypothetical protein MMC30_004918 [Trapelia coarctata]|nr:hypothetical protein [Trapelia coarctata]
MSLSFNVNVGPLSQVGLEIVSMATAYHLATGAYGWFKANERSRSLTQLLSVSGGELVGTSSFNFHVYNDIRTHHGMMQGVIVQEQKVHSTGLPKGSTAIPDHPGTACLRALTAGLLCLYELDATIEILQNLVPYALIQLHQDDATVEIEGPLLTSLRHWVSAIALEEDSDNFRKYMLQQIALHQSRLTGMTFDELIDMDHTARNEIPFVIGVLRWILTPLHKRQYKQYPTRSLQVWTAASIMETLGFAVQAASTVVSKSDDYGNTMDASYRFGEAPNVFLVVPTGEETDPMQVNEVPGAKDMPRSQITMIRGIPWIAFRHLRGTSEEIDTQYLADVWHYSFKSARACFRGIRAFKQNVKIEITDSELVGVSEHHKALLSEFSPHLLRICGPAMCQFVPMSSRTLGWSLSELKEQMRILRTEEERFRMTSPCRGNCYVLFAIVLGAIYGLCSNACFDGGDTLSEDSEVAFIPDIIYDHQGQRLKSWARTVGNGLNRPEIPFSEWSDLLFELFLGKETNSLASALPSKSTYTNQQDPYRERLFLGAQANGLTAVAGIVVVPSLRPESFCYFHIKRGQILNLPLTEDHYIQASSYMEPPHTIELDPEPRNSNLCRFDAEYTELDMRIDIEPCWETDPRTVLFVARVHGVPIASLNISMFLDRMSHHTVPCGCPEPLWEVPVPLAERWQFLSLYQLKRTTFKGMSFRRVDVNYPDTRILIDASQSVTATLYAVSILHVKQLYIAENCLACAQRRALMNTQSSGVTIIIPHSTDR